MAAASAAWNEACSGDDTRVDEDGDHACMRRRSGTPPRQHGDDMGMGAMGAIGRNAMIIGGAALGGAVIGSGTGAVMALKREGIDNQYARQEGRDTIANAIIGAGLGATAGVALITGRKFVPLLNKVPVFAMSPAMTIGAGAGFGAAAAGVGSLAFHALD